MRAIILRFPISKPVNETDTIGLHLLYLVHCIDIIQLSADLLAWLYHQNLDLQSYSKMNYVNTSEHLNQTV